MTEPTTDENDRSHRDRDRGHRGRRGHEAVEAVEPRPSERRAAPRVSPSSSTVPSRPSAAARRPWCGCAWCPAPASSTWTAARLEAYFPNKVHQQLIKAPLVTVDRVDSFDIYAHLDGGGPSGQAGALRLAIARALILVQPEDRPALKKAGFLTRDPRAIERKKYGLKKARKAPQYSKR